MTHLTRGRMAAVAVPPGGAAANEHEASSLAWHAQAVNVVLERFATTLSGLTADEAALRLDSYGPNELQAFERASPWHTLAAQFKNVLIVILLGATVVSGVLGHGLEAAVIAVRQIAGRAVIAPAA